MNVQMAEFDKPTSTKTRPELRARETRQKILEVARRQLENRSFSEFSISDLCQKCDMSRQTIYGHFPSKADLYQESRRRMIHELAEEFTGEVPVAMSPFDALHFTLRTLFELHSDERMRELRNSMIRDGASQPWLHQLFDQLVRTPTLRSLESYMLHRSRHKPMAVNAPKQIARHLWMLSETIALGQSDSNHSPMPRREIDEELEMAAQVYCSAIPASAGIA